MERDVRQLLFFQFGVSAILAALYFWLEHYGKDGARSLVCIAVLYALVTGLVDTVSEHKPDWLIAGVAVAIIIGLLGWWNPYLAVMLGCVVTAGKIHEIMPETDDSEVTRFVTGIPAFVGFALFGALVTFHVPWFRDLDMVWGLAATLLVFGLQWLMGPWDAVEPEH